MMAKIKLKSKVCRDEKSGGDSIVFLITEKVNPDRPEEKPKTIIVIAISGTHGFRDIVTDLNVFKKKFEDTDAKVHGGFYTQFLGLKPMIEKRVKLILKNTTVDEILITGHSLGGAVAAMFGAYLEAKFEDQDFRVITFGCPKPGNSDFMKLFQKRFVLILVFIFSQLFQGKKTSESEDNTRSGNVGADAYSLVQTELVP